MIPRRWGYSIPPVVLLQYILYGEARVKIKTIICTMRVKIEIVEWKQK